MTAHRICLAVAVAVALTGTSCDRERSNPLDPQGDFARSRPSTPAGLAAEPGAGVVRLSWQAVEDRDLAGYALLRSEDAAGEFTFLPGRGPGGGTITTGKTSYVDSLHSFPGRTFYYRVAAVDTSGIQSPPSGFVGATVLEDKFAPEPPPSLAAIPDEREPRITLVWTPPVRDAGGGELSGLAGYAILRGESGSGGTVPVDTVDADTRLYVDGGLKALTSYRYALVAFDEAGNTSRLSQVVQVVTSGLQVPANLVAESGSGRIGLSWEAVGDEELLGYDLYRSERPDEGFERLSGSEGTPFTTGRTSYVDTAVQPGRPYYYKVQSVGRTYRSELSPQVGAEALSDEVSPGVPRNVSAAAAAGYPDRITVRWSAPTTDSDGGELTGLSGFTVYRSEGVSGSLVSVATLGSDSREYVDEGLRSLTEYGYAVSAFDGAGNESGQSAVSRARTEGIAVPSGVRAEDGIGRIGLSWESVGDEELIGYDVYRSERPDEGFERLSGSEGTPFTTGRTSYVDTAVQPGRPYYYKVQSVGRTYRSELSPQVGAEALSDEVSPGVPRNVSASAAAGYPDRITVRWSAPTTDSDGGELTGLSGFTVYRSEGLSGSLVSVATLGSDSREYVDEGLRSLTEYGYAVSAFDGAGNESGQSAVSRARTEGIAVPSGVRAEDGIGRIGLSWESVGDEELIGYNVYRSERPDLEFERLDSGLGSFTTARTSFVDSNLTAGVRYYYKVSSVSSVFESELSSYVSGESQRDASAPEPPGGLVATALEEGAGIRLSWRASQYDADGGELTGLSGYVIFRTSSGSSERVAVDTVSWETTEYVDGDLAAAVVYTYALMAVDGSGNGSELSSPVSATTRGLAPPSGLSAASGIGRITVRWSGSDEAELIGYNVYRSERSDGGFERLSGSEGTPFTTGRTSYVDTAVQPGGPYYYKVQSVGRTYRSELSVFVDGEALADEVPPESPRNLSAVADESEFGRVSVTWNAPLLDDDGGELTGLSGYQVFRSQGTTDSFVQVAVVSEPGYEDTGLEESTTYYYTVAAVDGSGNESGRASPVRVKTQGEDRVSPGVPRNVSASAAAGYPDRITVRWSAPTTDSDGGELTGLSGFTVYRSEGLSGSLVSVATLGSDSREYVDEGLRSLTEYGYAVSAFDGAGNESGQSAVSRARTEGIAVPSGVRAEDGIGRIGLSWESVGDEELIGYNVYRSERSDGGFERLSGSEGTPFTTGRTSYVDTAVQPGGPYYYKVQSVGRTYRSELSVFVDGEALADEVPPESPRNLSAVADESEFGRVSVTWNAPLLDDDGGELTGLSGYQVFRSQGTTDSFVQVAVVSEPGYEDTGLEESTTYYYTVAAVDGSGNESGRASPVRVKTQGEDRVSPGVPRNVSASAAAGYPDRITVRWSAPTTDSDGGELTGLSGFTVYRSEGLSGSLVSVATLGSDSREYVDEGLRSLTEYGYAVSAFDGAGNESGQSAVSRARTEGIAVPSGVRAEDGIGRIGLSWESVGDEELIGYNVYRSERPDLEFERLDSGLGSFTTARTSFVDSNLTAGVRYYYKVSSVSSVFESELSSYVSGESQRDASAPEPPGGLVATALEEGAGIRLSWRASQYDADGGELTGLSGYVIFRTSSGSSERVAVDTVSWETTEYVDGDLAAAVVYTYALMAVDGSGNGSELSSPVSATTRGLAPPSGLSAASGIGRITVRWSGSDEAELIGYNVYRSERSDGGFERLSGSEGTPFTTGQTTYIDTGFVGGEIFFYRLSVVTSQGESELSEFAGATVESDSRPPAAPTFLSGEAVIGDPEVILLEWRPPSSDVGGAELTGLSGYLVFRADSPSGPFREIGTSETAQYRDSGLEQRTTYYYQVQALDPAENASAPSETESATTSGVDTPRNVTLSSTTPSDLAEKPVVTITWEASEGVVLRYEVSRTTVPNSTDDADYTEIPPASGISNDIRTSREDDSVKRGVTYYYRVRAVDAESRASDWTTPLAVRVSE